MQPLKPFIKNYSQGMHTPVSPFTECIYLHNLFIQDLESKGKEEFFPRAAFTDYGPLFNEIEAVKRDPLGRIDSMIKINFFQNRIWTYHKGETRTASYSFLIAFINDLGEMYNHLKISLDPVTVSFVEDSFIQQVTRFGSLPMRLQIAGSQVLKLYPQESKCEVVTPRGGFIYELASAKICDHLFNQEFIYNMCPLLDLSIRVDSLAEGLTSVYFGRCLFGVIACKKLKNMLPEIVQNEVERIVKLVTHAERVPASTPLL